MKKISLILFSAIILVSCGQNDSKLKEIELFPVKSGKEFQFIDREGKIQINPQFSEASIFRNGLSLVKTSGDDPKWGFISENGNYHIIPNYKSATIFNEDLAWVVSENSAPTAINSKGEIKFTIQDAETVSIFNEGLSAFSILSEKTSLNDRDSLQSNQEELELKWGFLDLSGKIKINPQFSNAGRFSEGKCPVQNSDGKWGYIDKDGKLIINYQFEKASEFINGKAVVFSNEKAGLINEEGKYLINPQFSQIALDNEKYLILKDEKWGWCDENGKIIINPQFKSALPFNGKELASVQSGEVWGYIDQTGKMIINPQFDYALPYNGDLALVLSGKNTGFINIEGKFLINPQFEGVSSDLVSFLITGRSMYESVNTDFFNINAIIGRVNLTNPEGLTLSSPLSDVVNKLKIKETDFGSYGSQHLLINNEKISNDASLFFYVEANAYKEVPDGWYTTRIFNPDELVQGYIYVINLTGKGIGKEENVFKQFESLLLDYKIDDAFSTEDQKYFNSKDGKHSIRLVKNSNQVIIYIYKSDENAASPEFYGGYSTADSIRRSNYRY